MNISLSTSRLALFAACAAFVTSGCSGGSSDGSGTPSTGAATGTAATGGNGATGGTAAGGTTAGTTADSGTPGAPTPAGSHAGHSRCGWIGADTFDAGKASFLANPDFFDAIHPKWATLESNGNIRILSMADDAQIMQTAKAHKVQVIPLIDSDDASYLRNIMATPEGIAAHAAALTDMVVKHGYDGVELDYEHLWSAADRAPYVALITAVSKAMHAQQKVLTLALPAMDADHKDAAYDYPQIQGLVDKMHLMFYDYHYFGGDHLGPLAPKGWINDVVTRVQGMGMPEKYTVGVANYGISSSWYASAKATAARCQGGQHSSQTDHMTTCPTGHQEAGLSPHCTTDQGEAWFEDTASMTEKVTLGKSHGFGGVGYWTMGEEPDGFFDAMTKLYPPGGATTDALKTGAGSPATTAATAASGTAPAAAAPATATAAAPAGSNASNAK